MTATCTGNVQNEAKLRPSTARLWGNWAAGVGSVVLALLAVPLGWLSLVAFGIPPDRGEEGLTIFMGTAGVFIWVILVGISAWVAYWIFGRLGNAIFLPALIINLAAVGAPVLIIPMLNTGLGYR